MPETEWVERLPEAQQTRMERGEHPMDPRRLGSSIAVVGGVVFVAANAPVLGAPVRWLLLLAAVALAAWLVWRLFLRPRSLGTPQVPHRFAGLIYLISVVAMLALIAAGGAWLRASGHEAAQPSLIALVVGLHFVPFAMAFREPMLIQLGTAVAAMGAVGLVLGILLGDPWGAGAAVAAGFVQLGVVAAWAQGLLRRSAV